MTHLKEKRRHIRKPYFMPVDYSAKNRFFKEYIHDISQGGLFIETVNPLPKGLEVVMNIPYKGQNYIHLKGKVVWVNSEGMAIQFDVSNQYALQQIDGLVEQINAVFI